MDSVNILNKISGLFFEHFDDFQGLYYFGSRKKAIHSDESDLDIILVFDKLDYKKELSIAHLINKLEFDYNLFIDYKTFTKSGRKSIDYIRNYINPLFIKEAIDNGIFYGKA